jgi:hypothetical protein
MNVKKLVEGFKLDPKAAADGLADGLKQKHIRTDEFNATELFIECFGYEQYRHYKSHEQYTTQQVLQEAGAVMTTSFQNISQQFLAATFMEAYSIPERVFMGLIPTVKTNRKYERLAGVTHVGDEADTVDEGKSYPLVGVGEDWVDTPEVRKRGMMAQITKETITFDETGLVVDRVKFLGDWLGLNQEKRAIDCVIDGNTTAHRYNWQGTVYASYVDTPWDNLVASNALADETDLDNAYTALQAIEDPVTGEPQNVTVRHLIAPTGLYNKALYALSPQIRATVPGFATTADPKQLTINNPVLQKMGGAPMVLSTQLVNKRLTAASIATTTWFLGDLTAYAEWREVWPTSLDTFGEMGQLSFQQDIVQQFKASQMGAYRVKNPRKMTKNTA